MKTTKFFSLIVIILACIFTSCEYVEFNPPLNEVSEANSGIRMKSANGFSSDLGTIYVQKDISTGLKVETKIASNPIDSAFWKIGTKDYKGVEILHKFTSLGEVSLTVTVKFKDKSTEIRTFKIQSVLDISSADPVRCFTTNNNNGTWQVLILVSKERLKYAVDTNFYYNGLVSNWEKKAIAYATKSYVIGTDGKPAVVKSPGKYIGIDIKLSVSGLYNFALIYDQTIWADLSGSAFIRKENAGLAWFYFDSGVITAKGESTTAASLPGVSGDTYFRFEQVGDTITGKGILYFKLDENFTTNAFVVRELSGGTYSAPSNLNAVTSFPEWGKIEIPIKELLGKVSGFKYGPSISAPTLFAKNMAYSFSYDEYFKNIRLSMLKV
ncbi:MAG: hypothetical protein ACOYL8_04360 [Patescibacteria group bacterium]